MGSFYGRPRTIVPSATLNDPSTYALSADVALGTVVNTNDGKQFIYVLSNTDLSSSGAGEPCKIDSSYVLTASGSGEAAFGPLPSWADADASTTNRYGWFQVGGVASCTTDGNVAAGDMIAWAASGSAEFIEIATVDEGGSATYEAKTINARGIALEDDSSTTGNILLFAIFPYVP